jgi:16S rRNA (cytosine967-C5)-methyltransferase
MSSKLKSSQTKNSARLTALHALVRVIDKGQSLTTVRQHVYEKLQDERDRGFAMELIQGVLRWRWKLDALLLACMDKPLRNKETELRYLLYIALYELSELNSADYAVVDEAVKITRKLKKPWASSLVNAVLRRYKREADGIQQSLTETQRVSHPQWLIDSIQHDWPEHWQQILANNNERAAICLRVNTMALTREMYLQKLQQKNIAAQIHGISDVAITLQQQLDVTTLPGYEDGEFSVQDAGAQLAADLLDVKSGQRVLDLCAAPGGKTCHVLERADNAITMLAVDSDEKRLLRVQQNLQRLNLQAEILAADASGKSWHQHEPFDRILLDAPCSATGVIRRHPDIKSLRRPDDLPALVKLQASILRSAWQQLRPGGRLLYVTCSVLAAENSQQIKQFISQQEDAIELADEQSWGMRCEVGRQLLPGFEQTDGFYYALLEKQ